MSSLVYHDPAASPGSTSVFDRTVMEIAEGSTVLIACPYLNLAILERIIARSGQDWRLLTDVEELFLSLSVRDRKHFAGFICEHRTIVRHVSGLHAKVIVAEKSALLGSANFTMSGMTRQTEMAVVVSSPEMLGELRRWFNSLWECAAMVSEDDIEMLIKALPDDLRLKKDASSLLKSSGVVVQARLVPAMVRPSGRWSESAFFGRVVERWEPLLELHNDLRERLKSLSAVQFKGDGPTLATYHVIIPGTMLDVAWVYEDGTVYIRWGKLREFGNEIVRRYQAMWGGLIDNIKANGEEKIDGCNLSGGLNTETISLIESNILRLKELIETR